MRLSCKKISAKIKALLLYSVQFRHYGKHSLILRPLDVTGKKSISIGDRVYIHDHVRLSCEPMTGVECPKIIIGDGATIGYLNHIYATKSIVIEPNVLTADKVYISDNLHSYEDVHLPVIRQPIKQLAGVVIGEGSWIGENVCVIGASIGKHCVIGANSVVTRDVPDYSVAVGAPAKVVKKYNFETKSWERV